MTERHQTVPRTLCIVYHNNKVLLIEYGAKKGEMAGMLNCPGGHIELSEGIIESASREIFEETGLKVMGTKLKGVVHVSNFFGKNVMMFVTVSQAPSMEVTESDEGKLHWVDEDSIYDLHVFEDLKTIFTELRTLSADDIFTAKSVYDGGSNLISMNFE